MMSQSKSATSPLPGTPIPIQPPSVGVAFGLSPEGQARVVVTMAGMRLEFDTGTARTLAEALVQMTADAEACSLLRDTIRARLDVTIPIPEAIAMVGTWRQAHTSPILLAKKLPT
jgi:hypothetical protein